jgi:tetratricopeptide (TPR) repeat protein
MLPCAHMRQIFLLGTVLCLAAVPLYAADALSDARRLYNQGQYDAAERAAREAVRVPATADVARVVLGRIQLERYRRTAAPDDLTQAIEALRSVDVRPLDPQGRIELTIGMGEALYLEDRFGAAAALFESALDPSGLLGPAAHERVLDWWATAMDRQALTRPVSERRGLYDRIFARMAIEIAKDAGSGPAGYWLAAAPRGAGDLEEALNQATAGWVRAALARDRGAALRADLDRLMVQGILPDRAARLPGRDHAQALAGMVGEWEAFKSRWAHD